MKWMQSMHLQNSQNSIQIMQRNGKWSNSQKLADVVSAPDEINAPGALGTDTISES